LAERRKDIVERLRDAMSRTRLEIFDDAADEIERLREALRAAQAEDASRVEEIAREALRDLGRRYAAEGGKARAASLSPERRKEIAQLAVRTRWARARERRADGATDAAGPGAAGEDRTP
jgi:hypothetical protein